MRIHELAREMGLGSDELLAECSKLGFRQRNRLAGVTAEEAARLKQVLAHKIQPPRQPAPAPVPVSPGPPPPAEKPPEAPSVAGGKAHRKKKPRGPAEPKVEVPARAEAVKGQEERPHVEKRKVRRDAEDIDYDPFDLQIQQLPSRYVPPSSIQRFPKRQQRRSRPKRGRRHIPTSTERAVVHDIEVPISLKDLSSITGIKANTLILKLMQAGEMVSITAVLTRDQVEFLAHDLGFQVTIREAATAEDVIAQIERKEDRPEDLKPRPPVVAFLGHVDHGKTTLMDYIRKANVVAGEYGGITQHIGAYRVQIKDRTVVFLDTPGHEAFTTMRARGANVTDIVTLIVAADDGVMPQTEEAIDHARAAGVPIVVAINKCDKPEANPMRVKQQLTNLGLQPEEWGGDTVCVEVSAITGKGVDDLIEMLSLVAELRELKANPNKPAQGTVLEARMTESRGPVATVLIQDGALRVGDVIVCGAAYGRAKALLDERGHCMPEAGPSTPVTVVGLDETPEAGATLIALDSLHQARAIAEQRREKQRLESVVKRQHVTLENLFDTFKAGAAKELRVILKADVRGSLEALNQLIQGIKSPEVRLHVLRSSVGGITTSDVILAHASDAIIIGLHVQPDGAARQMADECGVAVRCYNIIYRVKEEIERALVGLLEPEERETVTGHAEVRQLFKISRVGTVAGCYVTDGAITRSNRVRLIRDGAVIHDGRMASLKRQKDDVREAREGFECGIHIEGYDDVKAGDVIEAYTIEKIARTLEGQAQTG